MKISINPKLAVAALKQFVPMMDDFIHSLESDPEAARKVAKFAQTYKLDGYPTLYLDSQSLIKLVLLTLMPLDQITSLNEHTKGMSIGEATEYANQVVANMNATPEKLDELLESLWPDIDAANADELPQQARFALTTFLVWFHECVSFLVHGKKITALVQRAVKGDDKSLELAYQIDKSIINIPEIRERALKALEFNSESDANLLYNLAYRHQNPLLKGVIKNRKVWMSLLFIDTMGLLDGQLTHSEILDMFDEAGISGIASEDNLSKMIRKYRSFQAAS